MLSPKSRKRDQNFKKVHRRFSVFQFSFVATLSHWYHDWVNVALAGLEHTGMQSETQGVQSFGTKSGARAVKRTPSPAVHKSN